MGMQISTTHEAGLGWMGVNPAQNHKILRSTVIKECTLVDSFTCIACAFLLRYNNFRNEECVRDQSPTEHTAGLEVAASVGFCMAEELGAECWREEDCSERTAIFQVSGGTEGECWRGFCSRHVACEYIRSGFCRARWRI